jgi:hypothetical protein
VNDFSPLPPVSECVYSGKGGMVSPGLEIVSLVSLGKKKHTKQPR